MKITSFDRTNLRILTDEINEVLSPIADKYGINLTYRGSRFCPQNVTIKIEGTTVGTDGQAVTPERQDFIAYAAMYGLKPSDMGKPFNYLGTDYTICGLKTRSRTAPILATSTKNGKTYKFPAATVKLGLK